MDLPERNVRPGDSPSFVLRTLSERVDSSSLIMRDLTRCGGASALKVFWWLTGSFLKDAWRLFLEGVRVPG
jgi:hypothetical protein